MSDIVIGQIDTKYCKTRQSRNALFHLCHSWDISHTIFWDDNKYTVSTNVTDPDVIKKAQKEWRHFKLRRIFNPFRNITDTLTDLSTRHHFERSTLSATLALMACLATPGSSIKPYFNEPHASEQAPKQPQTIQPPLEDDCVPEAPAPGRQIRRHPDFFRIKDDVHTYA